MVAAFVGDVALGRHAAACMTEHLPLLPAVLPDGRAYSVAQGQHGVFTQWLQRIFLKEALGAAYTPLSIGDDGKVYTQNDGNLFVVAQ